jgi:SSS family transporter
MIIMTAYMLYRALYAGVVTFALALVLHVMTGMGLLPIIAVVGISTVIYTTLGGQRAVIWTDIAQFVIFFGGIILAFLIAIQKMPGGLPQILAIAGEANKLKLFDPSLSLTARYTTLTLLIMGFVDFLGSKSIDQLNVQRYLSTRTGADAKMAMLIQPLFAISIQFMLFALGVTLFAFYSFYPDPKVAMFVADKKIDQVFPYYILNVMPPGVKGLMIAALLAAAMSTLSAVMNMLSAIPITGIYKRIINPAAGDRRCVFLAKLLTVFWGIAITLLACCMLNIESVLQTCASITGLFIGPLLAIFVLGMFTRRANSGGVFLGLLAAFGVTLYLKNYTPLTFMLYGTCGLITAMITGYLASFFFAPPPSSKTKNLLWKWNGMKETFFGDGGVELHSLNIRIR